MVKKSKGTNFRTRRIFSKHPRTRGLPSLSRSLAEYGINSRVNIIIEPSV
ncbi:MAG: 50S ribosomal protein L21e, partial [Candidatus Heimdallarchaeota archaeon]|nr:50S ribosomal protein L21e [Candidatus Heimdallarchaeota archaeon]